MTDLKQCSRSRRTSKTVKSVVCDRPRTGLWERLAVMLVRRETEGPTERSKVRHEES